jgi:hypothetical protein
MLSLFASHFLSVRLAKGVVSDCRHQKVKIDLYKLKHFFFNFLKNSFFSRARPIPPKGTGSFAAGLEQINVEGKRD